MAGSDPRKLHILTELFKVPRENRDDAWTTIFHENVIHAPLAIREPEVVDGPDGFGYLALYPPSMKGDCETFSVLRVLGGCTDKGMGIAINPRGPDADWVFSYGQLWSLRAYGGFEGDDVQEAEPEAEPPVEESIEAGHNILFGPPSLTVFPAFARKVVKSFLLRELGLTEVRMVLLMDLDMRPSRNLVFNVHPDLFPDARQTKAFLDSLGWFLPPKLGVIAVERESELAGEIRYRLEACR